MCKIIKSEDCMYNIFGICELLSEPFINGKQVKCIKVIDNVRLTEDA